MHKVIFLNNWGEPIPTLLSRYSNQTPDNSGEWGNVKGVSDINEADYYVLMDGTSPLLAGKLDWSRVTNIYINGPDRYWLCMHTRHV